MRLIRFMFGLFCAMAFVSQAGFADPFVGSSNYQELLKKIEAQAAEQKMQAAQDTLNSGYGFITVPTEQARLLIKLVQLETALHGTETAVQLMKSKTWPKDPQALLCLGEFIRTQNLDPDYYGVTQSLDRDLQDSPTSTPHLWCRWL